MIDAVKKGGARQDRKRHRSSESAGLHLGFTATISQPTAYRQLEEVIFTVSSCWYFITICVGKTLQQTPPYMGVLSQFHQVVMKHARKTRQEIGSDLPVFHSILDRRTKRPPHVQL